MSKGDGGGLNQSFSGGVVSHNFGFQCAFFGIINLALIYWCNIYVKTHGSGGSDIGETMKTHSVMHISKLTLC